MKYTRSKKNAHSTKLFRHRVCARVFRWCCLCRSTRSLAIAVYFVIRHAVRVRCDHGKFHAHNEHIFVFTIFFKRSTTTTTAVWIRTHRRTVLRGVTVKRSSIVILYVIHIEIFVVNSFFFSFFFFRRCFALSLWQQCMPPVALFPCKCARTKLKQ